MLVLAGLILLTPIAAPSDLPPVWTYGAVIGLLAVQSVLNLLLWRRSDELLRRVTAETSALSFWVLQIALVLYASAERLGLVNMVNLTYRNVSQLQKAREIVQSGAVGKVKHFVASYLQSWLVS